MTSKDGRESPLTRPGEPITKPAYGLDHVFAAKFREPLAGLLTLILR
jgi:hypothetical protein